MVYAQTVVFHRAKAGSAPTEWEDGAGFDPGDPTTGRKARLIVVDGATEAYDSIRWVGQLVGSYLSTEDGPTELETAGLDGWFARMQQRWLDEAPATFANLFEERKFREDGSFATLLGCDVTGLGGRNGRSDGSARWRAVALGDAVLFHVRGAQLVTQFPALAYEDFGLDPDGVFTAPSQRGRMRDRLAFAAGELVVGDRLYLATDALAAWVVKATAGADAERVWSLLDTIAHPVTFDRWVAAELGNGQLKNDDVTLMRVQITGAPVGRLTVCGP